MESLKILSFMLTDKDLLHRKAPSSVSKNWKLKPSKQKCPESELFVNYSTPLNALPSFDCKTWFPQCNPCKFTCLIVDKCTILRQVLLHLQAYRKWHLDSFQHAATCFGHEVLHCMHVRITYSVSAEYLSDK